MKGIDGFVKGTDNDTETTTDIKVAVSQRHPVPHSTVVCQARSGFAPANSGRPAEPASSHDVGMVAHEHFGKGVEITEAHYGTDRAPASTLAAVRAGAKAIFEADACSSDGAHSRMDTPKKVSGSDTWDLIEVRSATFVLPFPFPLTE